MISKDALGLIQNAIRIYDKLVNRTYLLAYRGSVKQELKLIEIFKENHITGWKRNYPVKGHPDFVFLDKIGAAVFAFQVVVTIRAEFAHMNHIAKHQTHIGVVVI